MPAIARPRSTSVSGVLRLYFRSSAPVSNDLYAPQHVLTEAARPIWPTQPMPKLRAGLVGRWFLKL
jgi:hypothetical protein